MKTTTSRSVLKGAPGTVVIPEVEHIIGLDLGDSKSQFAVMDYTTSTVGLEGQVPTSPSGFTQFFRGYEGAVVVMEVGSQSRWASRLLIELGLTVYVANPSRLKFCTTSKDKDDRSDARNLAFVGRLGPQFLYPIQHRPEDQQADLEILKARDVLVGVRTKTINHVRGVLKSAGSKAKKCSSQSFATQVKEFIPDSLAAALQPLIELIDTLKAKIATYDKAIDHLCRTKYRHQFEILNAINGVGPVTALTFILTINDPGRFKKSRDVGSYLGLRPRRCQSGDHNPQLPINKAGDRRLRVLLVQCAQYMLGHFGKDSDLRRWGLRKAEHGGKAGKKKAIVAVARKLAVLMHRLLTTGEVYEPLRHANKAAPPSN
jgi:transposase